MNDDFVTMAIQEDRYLKAIQLIDEFETELRRALEHIGNQFIEENQELFVERATPAWNNNRGGRSVLAWARVDCDMDRRSSIEEGAQRLKLNLAFQWMDAAELGVHEDDGVLSIVSYKIKHARDEDHNQVEKLTREEEWEIYCGEDHFNNSPGIFYIPVTDADDIRDAFETLKEHFSEYGGKYGVRSD